MPVIKILSRHSASYESLLKYILKIGKPEEKSIKRFTHNIRSRDIAGMAREFKENESYRNHTRRPNSILIYHEIISFSTKDKGKINREIAVDIAKKYMRLRGHTGIFVGAVHEEKDHLHIHLAASGLHFKTGKVFRLSRADLQKLKQDVQQYHIEKYPEIAHSTCEHGTNKPHTHDRQWYLSRRNDRKADIEKKVAACLRNASTQTEFLELLREQHLHHYERSQGVITGVMVDTVKYRFNRLDIDQERLRSLPIDMTAEQKALKEIEEIRQSRAHSRMEGIER